MGNQEEACSVTTGNGPRGQGLEEEGAEEEHQEWKQSLASINGVGLLPWRRGRVAALMKYLLNSPRPLQVNLNSPEKGQRKEGVIHTFYLN